MVLEGLLECAELEKYTEGTEEYLNVSKKKEKIHNGAIGVAPLQNVGEEGNFLLCAYLLCRLVAKGFVDVLLNIVQHLSSPNSMIFMTWSNLGTGILQSVIITILAYGSSLLPQSKITRNHNDDQ